METITEGKLLELLSEIKGATFATIVASTDPKLLKTGNPFKGVRKVSRVNVTLGFQYENAVNRQRTREEMEADFKAEKRAWGEKVSPMFVEHKGKLYLETMINRSVEEAKYLDAEGKEIDSESIKPFLPKRSESSRQETEKEILVRDYAIGSIVGITIKGKDFVIAR